MDRTEPMIDRDAANRHMPKGFRVIDPDTPMGQVQLAGMEIHALASAHLAASNRALWRRVAELEKRLEDRFIPPRPQGTPSDVAYIAKEA